MSYQLGRIGFTSRYQSLIGALGVFALLLGVGSNASAAEWEFLKQQDGIVVSAKESKLGNLPVFRGVGQVRATIPQVLAVMQDAPGAAKWMHQCLENRPLEIQNVYDRIVYNRTKSPWPVWDRDVVVQTKGRLDVKRKRIVIEMRSITDPRQPEIDGVVRIPRLNGHYILRFLAEDLTEIEYQIDADPGGSLPTWLARLASKDLPYFTIRNLRNRVLESIRNNEYQSQIALYESMNPLRSANQQAKAP